MLRHRIIVFLLFLGFLFFFGFLATYSKIERLPSAAEQDISVPATVSDRPDVIAEVPPLVPSSAAVFGRTVELKLHDTVSFPDGLVVTLKQINDSRCPKEVDCIWAGELSGVFTLSDANTDTTQEITLSTIVNKTATLGMYTFALKDASPERFALIVSKQ